MKIRLLVTGRRYHQAVSLPDELEVAAGGCVRDALDSVNELLPEAVKLEDTCMLAVNGSHVGSVADFQNVPLTENAELVVFSPVAGG